MPKDLDRIKAIEVPVKVVIGQRPMSLREIRDLMPGTIIELPKQSDEELELVVNNKPIGTGNAVKIVENFGIKIAFIGDLKERLEALANQPSSSSDEDSGEVDDAEALAEALLSGQF